MHERLLGRAAKPVPVTILGLPLRPYSIGHELCLIEAGNPLWHSNEGLPTDVAEAAWICSSTWRENLRDPLFRLKKFCWSRRMWINQRRINHALNLQAFREYRDAGSLEFPLSQRVRPDSDPASRLLGTPLLLRLWAFLRRRYGLSEENAWDYPLGFAKCLWMEYWEGEGGLSVVDEWEAVHDAKVKELKEQLKAKGFN